MMQCCLSIMETNMNLVMCCTPVGKEDVYQLELRQALLAAIFFRNSYPNSKVFVLTTPEAVIPDYYSYLFEVLRFDFRKHPFAIARQLAYKFFLDSNYFESDTFFTGCDVFFCKPANSITENSSLAMTYRYHLTQPYCSDLFYVPLIKKDAGISFLDKIIKRMLWMPLEIQAGWADQICLAIEIGHLEDHFFNGKEQNSPRLTDFKLFPGDDYLFTPNDFFSSIQSEHAGAQIKDCTNSHDMLNLFHSKYVIHFKGARKDLMFIFAKLCDMTGGININYKNIGISRENLFKIY